METNDIKDFYNTGLKKSTVPYEQNRWFSSPQKKAGYKNTESALTKYALPYVFNDMHILELGPGPGTWTKCLLEKASKARYDLVDISEEMLKQAATALSEYANIKYITSDILDFNPEKQYDFFFSSRIIEYVPQKEEAVSIIVKAMRPGAYGYIVTKTPQYKRKIGTSLFSAVHQEQIHPSDLETLFKVAGCKIIKKVHVTCVFPKLHSGLLDSVLTKVCTLLPFVVSNSVSESYALIFQKK